MKKLISIAMLSVIALTLSAQEDPIAIIHGPYLQNVTETEATIVWITNRNSVGWIETAPDDGSHFYAEERPMHFDAKNGIKNEGRIHCVKLTGLTPGTIYRYRVMSKDILEHKMNQVTYGRTAYTDVFKKKPLQFTTAAASKPSVKFAMVNDIHGNNDLLRKLLSQCDLKKMDFVLYVGDMASMFNTEDQVFDDFMDTSVELFARETPMYYTRGNHETRGTLAYHFQDYFSPKQEHIYYMYRQGPVCFIALDCGEDKPDSDHEYSDMNVYDDYRSEQAEWLKAVVKSEEFKTAPFKIVTCHMPPLEGWHGEVDIRAKLLPILNEAGIDLMLCAHHHRLIVEPKGKVANFPVIVNANNMVLQGEVTDSQITVTIHDESGKKTYEMKIDK